MTFDELVAEKVAEALKDVAHHVLGQVQVSTDRRARMFDEVWRLHTEEHHSLQWALDQVIYFGLPDDPVREKTGLRGFIESAS